MIHSIKTNSARFNIVGAAAFAASLLAAEAVANAQATQTVYDADFQGTDGTGQTYSTGAYPGGTYPNLSGQNGWVDSDTNTAGNEPDGIGYIPNISTTHTDNWAFLGTTGSPPAPLSNPVYLYNPFSISPAASSYSFTSDFIISSASSSYSDTFSWVFRDNSGNTLFSVNLSPDPGNPSNPSNLRLDATYTVGGVTSSGADLSIAANAKYLFSATVNATNGTFSASFTLPGDPSSPVTSGPVDITGSPLYTTDGSADDVSQVAMEWNQATFPGNSDNTLYFNDYTVVESVPEPSTYVMLGFGLLGLTLLLKNRSRRPA